MLCQVFCNFFYEIYELNYHMFFILFGDIVFMYSTAQWVVSYSRTRVKNSIFIKKLTYL